MAGQLPHNLVLFGRLLRRLGLPIGPGKLTDALQALRNGPLESRADFYYTLRTLMLHRRDQQPVFDAAFRAFWRAPGRAAAVPGPESQAAQPRQKPAVAAPPLREQDQGGGPKAGDEDGLPPLVEARLTYNAAEVLRRKDFAQMTPEELAAARRAMDRLRWRLAERRSRRRRPGRGSWLDLRRTLRGNLRHGGELMRWVRRRPRHKPRLLVVMADISGSMEPYARLLLHFTHSLGSRMDQPVEAFVFATRLTRITRQLIRRDAAAALREVSGRVPDWSSGTRIGECLREFNLGWGRRLVGRGAVVLLISDGWDRGDPNLLSREAARLARNCHRLIWLNPLLGTRDYQPLTRGMAAALPHIDDFLPVHNLASLEDLAARLRALPQR